MVRGHLAGCWESLFRPEAAKTASLPRDAPVLVNRSDLQQGSSLLSHVGTGLVSLLGILP